MSRVNDYSLVERIEKPPVFLIFSLSQKKSLSNGNSAFTGNHL